MNLIVLLLLVSSVDTSGNDAFAHYQLGIAEREAGDNRKAIINLQAAIAGGFDNLGARLNLMEAAFACGQSTLGLETAEKIMSADLKSADVLLRCGRLLFDHLFYKAALQAFEQAQRLAPGAFEPRFRLALTHYLLEDYAAAVAALQPAAAFEANPEAASLLASAQAKSGDFASATALLQHVIVNAPVSPHAYVNLALIDLDRGESQAAEAMLERFRVLDSKTSAKVFYAVSRNSCSLITNAVEHEGGPAHPSRGKAEFYYQLASQLQERFNYLSAVELIRLAQINEGNSARVLLVAGTSCLNQDPLATEPVLLLRRAIAADGSLHQAFYLLGRAYARQGNLDEAVKAYRKAADLHPTASYYVSLGKERNPQEAVAEFQRAVSLDQSYAPAHLELGRAYVQTEELGKARLELEKALELEPDFYEAEYLLGRLLHRLGEEAQSQAALKLFAEKKGALMQQSAIGAGYVGQGR